ncbi:hypothetical protein [Synechococcus sp. 1G10]|uniref:glycosyltransferase family protein n=1 Tax=Synechococcus sp. 1G10 TaxID=2025605 RepID=UPI000B998A70|nr:hypothetical protein [Synechococcus sp. 1G10]
MDFIFVHGNYPAQFRILAGAIASSTSNRVFYLTGRKDANKIKIKNVNIVIYEARRTPHKGCHPYLISTEEAVLNGQAVLRKLLELMAQGVTPSAIITHGGNGLGMFVKHACPFAKHISYLEWYFNPDTSKFLYEDFDINARLSTHVRNMIILSELESSDCIVVPTEWQRQQFPGRYYSKANVIFDGIDVSFFCPHNTQEALLLPVENSDVVYEIPADCRVLSYMTRGMEPLRGFPEFMRILPSAMAKFPDLRVVIAGQDRYPYSYGSPSLDRSWKTFMLKELAVSLDLKRIYFVGLLPHLKYRDLLRRSDLHCYFTRPYVTSWSLFEAAACGANLMVNRSPATEGALQSHGALWVDLDNQKELIEKTLSWLSDAPKRRNRERVSALSPEFSIGQSLRQWNSLLKSLLLGE